MSPTVREWTGSNQPTGSTSTPTSWKTIFQFVNAPNQSLAWGEFSNVVKFRQFGRDVDV